MSFFEFALTILIILVLFLALALAVLAVRLGNKQSQAEVKNPFQIIVKNLTRSLSVEILNAILSHCHR